MRVLHVLRSDGFAGVERHVATLAAAQSRAGHDVRVIGGDSARMRAALEGTTVSSLVGNTVPEVIAAVRRSKGADIVHAHMTAGELAASVAGRAPLVVTRHFARPRGATPVGRISGQIIRRRVSAQIAISGYVADAVDGPATVVHPGVPAGQPGTLARQPVVLVVQRLQPEKKTDVALRAFAAGAPRDWTLKVVGRGAEMSVLQALAAGLGIKDRTSFVGFRDDVPALMRASSVLLAPCDVEGLGLSVLEAMAEGLPVIASRAGAHPETVGLAPNPYLFEPDDWRQAGAMLAALAADRAERERYGADLVRVQLDGFTPETQVRATDVVYQEVLG